LAEKAGRRGEEDAIVKVRGTYYKKVSVEGEECIKKGVGTKENPKL